jgi:hypothetical protein
MRTLLHIVALIVGAAIVYRGLADGLPAAPFDGKAWGSMVGFGFGALMVLVGLRHLGLIASGGDDAPIGGGTGALMVVVAVVLTAGAVAWRGRDKTRECDAVIEHLRALAAARDPSAEADARFEQETRPQLMHRCRQMTSAQRRCPMRATSIEELQLCP